MKVLLVVNPISGSTDKTEFINQAKSLCQKYGIELEEFHTTGKDDVINLEHKVKEYTPDKVASVGGDGTTLMTSLALLGSHAPMGIVPLGSANGMAKELGVSHDPLTAFHDILLTQVKMPLDIIKVNSEFCSIHLGDVGINATIVEKYSKEEERGWAAYAKHFFSAIAESELFNVSIEIDGEIKKHEAYTVIIANTRMYGTGAVINPKGNPHDGLLEIVVVHKRNLEGLINLGLSTISEDLVSKVEDHAKIYQVEKAKITFEEPKTLQLDGELTGKHKELCIEIIPGAVNYLSTTDNIFYKP
ncbi:diacylglycerol/lipid kinase family protein [Sediminitomix flava]|uniref:YegS/Rv2252/BmrU family lipid kinase n=1 Tax=Sediminitomix flava TaxID=379075 RepID=A0A315YXH2_SEDFL|nr:diacylglycerol kinase family protein [Sediminitomix flava]PWJ34177.1 YegS/Rv2252/BmrU family lipid kinase [Sediminitomix flava]